MSVRPGHHREHGGLAATRVADHRDELAFADLQIETIDHGLWTFGCGVDLDDLGEIDKAVVGAGGCERCVDGDAFGHVDGGLDALGQGGVAQREAAGEGGAGDLFGDAARGQCGQLNDVAALAGGVFVRQADQVLGDLGAQLLEARVVVHGAAVARAGNVDHERGAERGAGADVERDDAVGHHQGFVHIVGDEHHGLGVFAPDAHDLVLQVGAGQGVERRERLVEQQHIGVGGQGARHRHALAHAAGELGGLFVDGGREAHHGHIALHPLGALGRAFAGEHAVHRQRHVVAHAEPGHQRIALEHDAAVGAGAGDGLAVLQHVAAVGADQAREQADQRGLAAAGKPDDGHELARLHAQVQVLQDLGAASARAIAFADVFQLQRGGVGHGHQRGLVRGAVVSRRGWVLRARFMAASCGFGVVRFSGAPRGFAAPASGGRGRSRSGRW